MMRIWALKKNLFHQHFDKVVFLIKSILLKKLVLLVYIYMTAQSFQYKLCAISMKSLL